MLIPAYSDGKKSTNVAMGKNAQANILHEVLLSDLELYMVVGFVDWVAVGCFSSWKE